MSLETESLLHGEELEWINAARDGDRQAFARIVERYWDRLYRWLFHLTRDRHQAEDLVQETFLKALAGLKSFQPGTNFRAWLYRIGHNNFVNLKRANRVSQAVPETLSDEAHPAPELAAQREALQLVAEAVANLPEEYRSAILLRTDEGMSFREIAEALAITEETARWRVFKARKKLLARLPEGLIAPNPEDL